MKILVTGAIGFIGYHVTQALIARGDHVVGLDNVNDYYDPKLKLARLESINKSQNASNFFFKKVDISDNAAVSSIFSENYFDAVINLAAQAGVRYSLENPHAYVDSNIVGFTNILEGCRAGKIKHLVYASSSSVYGMNTKQPFSVKDVVDFPISLYAATKKSNELMAHTYSHLFNIPTTGLRFFTVYGPFGRPDMAYFKFTKAILENKTIDVFNEGKMERDFTYIDDIVKGVIRTLDRIPKSQANRLSSVSPPYKIYNIGNNSPVSLERFIKAIENSCKKQAKKNFLPMQPGDVISTYADIDELSKDIGFNPSTSIEDGINNFVKWYRDWNNV